MNVEQRWGESVITQLSKDLKEEMPDVNGLSKTNIYYCHKFYQLYNPSNEIFHQIGGIFEIPWCHHCLIMDKVKGDVAKAIFYIR